MPTPKQPTNEQGGIQPDSRYARDYYYAGIVLPIFLLLLWLGALLIPHVGFPPYNWIGAANSANGLTLLRDVAIGADVGSDAAYFSFSAIWTNVAEGNAFYVTVAIIAGLLLILMTGLLVTCLIFAIMGIYCGATGRTQKALWRTSLGAWCAFGAQLIGIISVLAANLGFNWRAFGGGSNFSSDYLLTLNFAPSLAVIAMTIVALILAVAAAIVRRSLRVNGRPMVMYRILFRM
ncbi:MAG: hypothetical protein LBR39_04000 [Coriobacteriales bacterium]|jgi:hypothetical protein|nr:hypothetical protein [Coriobacteriales bacterium]